jgi:hypothetical protein
MSDSRLSHDPIGGMAREDFAVDRKIPFANGAVPNFVIAFAGADEIALLLSWNPFYFRRETARH